MMSVMLLSLRSVMISMISVATFYDDWMQCSSSVNPAWLSPSMVPIIPARKSFAFSRVGVIDISFI